MHLGGELHKLPSAFSMVGKQLIDREGLVDIFVLAIPAMVKNRHAVFQCPFDLPVNDFGVVFVVPPECLLYSENHG